MSLHLQFIFHCHIYSLCQLLAKEDSGALYTSALSVSQSMICISLLLYIVVLPFVEMRLWHQAVRGRGAITADFDPRRNVSNRAALAQLTKAPHQWFSGFPSRLRQRSNVFSAGFRHIFTHIDRIKVHVNGNFSPNSNLSSFFFILFFISVMTLIYACDIRRFKSTRLGVLRSERCSET